MHIRRTIQLGGSIALRIPKAISKAMNVSRGDYLRLDYTEIGELRITKLETNPDAGTRTPRLRR